MPWSSTEAQDYDAWYDRYRCAYETELAALRVLLPEEGEGLEVGVGTGRFASALGIRVGVEPSKEMAQVAHSRSVAVCLAVAEALPFQTASFDRVLMVTALCFVPDAPAALREAARVLRPGGVVVVADIDPESFLGREYAARRARSAFLRDARFHSVEAIEHWLSAAGFQRIEVFQTLFHSPQELTTVEQPRRGHGEGGVVLFRATKP